MTRYTIMAFLLSCIFAGGGFLACSSNSPLNRGTELIQDLQSDDPDRKLTAFDGLVAMGEDAVDLLLDGPPPLAIYYGPRIVRKIGTPAVQPLIDELAASTDEARRRMALRALGWLGEDAQIAAPTVVQELADSPHITRKVACQTLGSLGVASEAVKEALVDALEDPEIDVVLEAALALGRVASPEDNEVIQGLQRMLEREPVVIMAPVAASSLYRLGWNQDEMYAIVERHALDDSSLGSMFAIRGLIEICNDKSMQTIQEIMESRESDRIGILHLIGEQRIRHPMALQLAIDAAMDPDAEGQLLGIALLEKMGAYAVEALPLLRDVRDGRREVSVDAIEYSAIEQAISFIEYETEHASTDHSAQQPS